MAVLISICLGIIQGLTEFLPVSSSGHLVLAQKLLGVSPDLFTNVALHCGTLVAVIIFYRRQLADILRRPFGKKGLWLITATLPTAAIAVAVKFLAEDALTDALLPIGFALTVVLLLTCDMFRREKNARQSAVNAVIAGVAQGISVVPGLSRSGATICALKWAGVNNSQAVELSFLMSVPVILGSIIFMSFDVAAANATIDWAALLAGVATSGVCGYLSLRFLKKIADKGNLSAFGYYAIFPFLLSCVVY